MSLPHESSTSHPHSKPELLAPAGDRLCVKAAIENGADAVYFGLQSGFNARARAANFTTDELPDVMKELHERGVKGYVTLNTLVFTEELREFETLLRHCARSGVDAVLLQDLGACRIAKGVCPDLPIHASTQMTLTSAEGLAAVAELHLERVVLPRELSLDEIRQIRQHTSLPLEVFVHGALCVAYSGQCLTSESLGGRSANRGQCAQACRLPYEVICDGNDVDLGAQKYLLSPQDLAAYELTEDLIKAGVNSFKIEGRLKSPEYVANITSHYRAAIDQAMAGMKPAWTASIRETMELSFSRGFSTGWLNGCNHKELVPGLSSSKRGVLLGKVVHVGHDFVGVELVSNTKPGDGIVFDGDRFMAAEIGGRIYEIYDRGERLDLAQAGQTCDLFFATDAIAFDRLFVGQHIWKTDDPQLTRHLQETYLGDYAQHRLPISFEVRACAGEPLVLSARTSTGISASATSQDVLPVARNRPVTPGVPEDRIIATGKNHILLWRDERTHRREPDGSSEPAITRAA